MATEKEKKAENMSNPEVVIVEFVEEPLLEVAKPSAVNEPRANYSNTAAASVQSLVADLVEAGVFKKQTIRKFDKLSLTEIQPMPALAIKEMRESSGVSQAVLARMLNVTTNAVGQWERGEKKPSGSSLKLLNLARAKGLSSIL